jgi:hypothetical protein
MSDVPTIKLVMFASLKLLSTLEWNFSRHPMCASRHITARYSPLPLAPCVFFQAHHSEILASSSGTVCVLPGTSQRDTRLFLWHRVCSSRHITARYSPLPLAPCVFFQAHYSEVLPFSSFGLWYHTQPQHLNSAKYRNTDCAVRNFNIKWLRRYVTNRKVVGSKPDEVNDFYQVT